MGGCKNVHNARFKYTVFNNLSMNWDFRTIETTTSTIKENSQETKYNREYNGEYKQKANIVTYRWR